MPKVVGNEEEDQEELHTFEVVVSIDNVIMVKEASSLVDRTAMEEHIIREDQYAFSLFFTNSTLHGSLSSCIALIIRAELLLTQHDLSYIHSYTLAYCSVPFKYYLYYYNQWIFLQ